MFKANRVGTPYIHTNTASINSGAFTIAESLNSVIGIPFNVINSVPVEDFGRSQHKWHGAQGVSADYRIGFAQQFTVRAPLKGNAVGIEVMGSFVCDAPQNSVLIPFFVKMPNPANALLAPVYTTGAPTYFDGDINNTYNGTSTATDNWKVATYKEQFIIKEETALAVAGTYAHGVAIHHFPSGAWTLSLADSVFSVRQFSDDATPAYRDPFR